MKLMAIKCPNCGAALNVEKNDNRKKCDYCNCSIMIDDGIERIEIKNLPTLENYLKLGDRYYRDNSFHDAYTQYDMACNLEPDLYIAVLRRGLSKAMASGYESFDIDAIMNSTKNSYNILIDNKANDQTLNSVICESIYAVMYLHNIAIDYFNDVAISKTDINNYVKKLQKCLDAFIALLSLVKNDDEIKNALKKNIVGCIDNILSKKKYIDGVNLITGEKITNKYKLNWKYKWELKKKKRKYSK